ncbi:MAG: DUF4922 domain-containing protein [Desulfosudis oleivorans]|nr:DUF4922 domain-containing protein [Desulfosudis oleivorans]
MDHGVGLPHRIIYHFQAMPAGRMPVEQEIREAARLSLVAQIEDVLVYRVNDMGREIIVLVGDNRVSMAYAFARVFTALKKGHHSPKTSPW